MEDRDLKSTLDESKVQSDIIVIQLAEGKVLMDQIDKVRAGFITVATRVSNLFIDVLIKLITVNAMYQYSLAFYRDVYEMTVKSINNEEEKMLQSERKIWFVRNFTYNLYKNICRSLYATDKLLFSFSICLSVMQENCKALSEEFPMNEVRFMLAGATQVECDRPNPTGNEGWLSDKSWASILELS
mgnify:CR=1 FL=1